MPTALQTPTRTARARSDLADLAGHSRSRGSQEPSASGKAESFAIRFAEAALVVGVLGTVLGLLLMRAAS